ncbi:hypothetical protein [Spirosoma telluris]
MSTEANQRAKSLTALACNLSQVGCFSHFIFDLHPTTQRADGE